MIPMVVVIKKTFISLVLAWSVILINRMNIAHPVKFNLLLDLRDFRLYRDTTYGYVILRWQKFGEFIVT